MKMQKKNLEIPVNQKESFFLHFKALSTMPIALSASLRAITSTSRSHPAQHEHFRRPVFLRTKEQYDKI